MIGPIGACGNRSVVVGVLLIGIGTAVVLGCQGEPAPPALRPRSIGPGRVPVPNFLRPHRHPRHSRQRLFPLPSPIISGRRQA